MLALAVRFPLAQVTSGTISGIVRDTSGAVIPGVAIGLRNLETGTTREIMTNDQGRYTAANLPLGNYEIRAQKEGFEVQIRRGVVLTVGREAVVNFELPVGAVTQMVEVTGEAPLIETTTSSISAMVEKVQIQDLPLNGRSFDNLAVLQPGVALSRFQSRAFQNSYTTKISIRGARSEQNSFLLDGTDVMGPTNNIPGGVGGESLGVDTVREFRVETTTFSAQYGRAAGGVINVITTSGTNEFRGTVFEFLRNDNLDARNFFDRDPRNPLQRSDPPEFKRNQFGFSAGGPIRADKLFFFGSYEGLRERLGQTITSRVPTAEARQGRLPTQTVSVNADIVPYLNLYPLPNSQDRGDGTADFIRRYSQPTDHDFWTARLDYNMSSSDSMFARYTFDDSSRLRDAGFDFLIENQGSRNQFLTVEHSHIFSPALLNTFRFGFNRSFSDLQPETPGLDDSTLNRLAFIPGRPLFKSGNGVEPGGGVTGLVINPNAPRIFAWNLFEWSDDIAYTRGTHTLKGGFLIKKLQFNQIEALNSGGVYTFGSLADFLQGARANVRVLQGPGLALGWRYAYYGWYVQDDIRIGSQLTLNLGFRHEFYTKPTEKYNRVCNLDYLLQDFRCGGSLWPSYYSGVKNFGPRFGFAWDLFGEGKTSVRGGFGIFYDAMSPIWWVAPADTQPPSATRLSADNVPFPNLGAQLAAGVGQIQLSPSPAGFTGTPSTMQWSLTVQRQLPSDVVLSLGYAGS
ncbi:MAG TPA: carboxypeptidase regulatory-like domain-containing protein, partial [Chthonomonadales bacterium]|nr:carboxypeptidase regulatory-like domain-containing protein [Chthonomonadales bacterium]